VGLGHEFLRHIRRTRVLIHVLDGSGSNPLEAFHQINQELAQYDSRLNEKQQLIALNKMDLPEAREAWPALALEFRKLKHEAFSISGATHDGIDQLMNRTAELLREQARKFEESDEVLEVIVPKPPADQFSIERKRRTFHVTGESVERLVVMTDMDSEEGVYRLQKRLKQMGIFKALAKGGAIEGSRIIIGKTEFAWDSSYEPLAKPISPRATAASRKARAE
jgi:GTPase